MAVDESNVTEGLAELALAANKGVDNGEVVRDSHRYVGLVCNRSKSLVDWDLHLRDVLIVDEVEKFVEGQHKVSIDQVL